MNILSPQAVERAKRVVRMLRHPARIPNQIGLRVTRALRLKTVPFSPMRLDVEPNNDCNLKCDHCQVTHWDKKRVHMDVDGFKRVLDQLPHLVGVKLQGMGEPLLNKNLLAMLELGEGRGIEMQFTTNGTVMTDKILDGLMKLKHTHIVVSVDGATKGVFEAIRAGAKFERVTENIKKIVDRRAANGGEGPKVTIWTVLTARNLREAPDIVRLAKKVGADWITLQTFLGDWGKKAMKDHTDPIRVTHEAESMRETVAASQQVAADEAVTLDISYNNHFSAKKPCPWPWTGAYVASTGDVVPCCVIADSDTVKMGNIFEQDFFEIWNSAAYKDLRTRLAGNDPPDYCKTCYGR